MIQNFGLSLKQNQHAICKSVLRCPMESLINQYSAFIPCLSGFVAGVTINIQPLSCWVDPPAVSVPAVPQTDIDKSDRG
ncbi:hypothetical protein Bca4012_093385 [Brassica carinata]